MREKTALAALMVIVLASFAYAGSMTRSNPGNNKSPFWCATPLNGDTGTVTSGDTVNTKGLQTLTVALTEGGTTIFTVQASFDGCSNFITLDTFSASTVKPYRDIWADCVRVNTSWTAGAQYVRWRGR